MALAQSCAAFHPQNSVLELALTVLPSRPPRQPLQTAGSVTPMLSPKAHTTAVVAAVAVGRGF
jgi:hypothetical protein